MRGHGLSRLLAGFLCLLLLVGILPVSAFAASEGQQASSAYGDTVIGSDGQPYYSPSGYYTMTYHDDGSTSYVYHGGNVAYRHFVLNTDGGGFRFGVRENAGGDLFNSVHRFALLYRVTC